MTDEAMLKKILGKIDRRGYKAYKDLEGEYNFDFFTLFIDHVQSDPFAPPSRLRARVPAQRGGFPENLVNCTAERIAMEDYLSRCFNFALLQKTKTDKNSPKAIISIDCGKQEILERSSAVFEREHVEVRFSLGLPARGRTILGKQAEETLCRLLPDIVYSSLLWKNIDQEGARKHIYTYMVQECLRQQLAPKKLVAFIADGAILPRESGISTRPMHWEKAVPFESPKELSVMLEDHQGEKISGSGIPEGVTLIVGGGYHGKSTLLRGIEQGVYNHIPGDGQEMAVTRNTAFKIRAEDGRKVARVDISPFINDLPGGRSTKDFSSEDSSGSTSQAANIMEAIEVGTELLLIDEDTSATNFMIRDARMQALVAKEKEPITPFIDKVQMLYKKLDISTLLVIGGSGDYLDVADTVIMLDEYHPYLVTAKAKKVAGTYQTGRKDEGGGFFGSVKKRTPLPSTLDPQKVRKVKISSRGINSIQYGRENIDLSFIEQIVDPSQVRAIGDFIFFLVKQGYLDGNKNLEESLRLGFLELEKKGLDIISPYYGQHPGEYAKPRPLEVAAAINRLRTLRIK